MNIDGPLKIGVLETPGDAGWELHIDFRPEFRDLTLHDQSARFRGYLTSLVADLNSVSEGDRDYQGILLIQQIAEQLLPHVESGDLALNETIVVEIAQAPATSLQDLINSGRA
ncbi:MAG: transcriptional regulator [Pseudomonadota bacterium]